MTIFNLALVVVGVVLGFEGPFWASILFSYVQNRKIIKEITPKAVDTKKLCKTHSWINARSVSDRGLGSEQVCQICGFIPSINMMASPEAIDRIEEVNRIRTVQERIYSDFLAQENGDIKRYFDEEIKQGISFEKLVDIHTAGATFNARFNIYKTTRAGEIEKALMRNDA